MKNIEQPVRVFRHRARSRGRGGRSARSPVQAATRRDRIAVLPFANMSGDAEQEYFADGITEDIITDLSKVSALSVIARNSVFTYKGKHADIQEVGRRFNVAHVLEGSVRKAGNRVRITAQLIDARDGTHLWAERYDRDLTDIFAVQDEITKMIVDQLKVRLLPQEKKAIEAAPTKASRPTTTICRAAISSTCTHSSMCCLPGACSRRPSSSTQPMRAPMPASPTVRGFSSTTSMRTRRLTISCSEPEGTRARSRPGGGTCLARHGAPLSGSLSGSRRRIRAGDRTRSQSLRGSLSSTWPRATEATSRHGAHG